MTESASALRTRTVDETDIAALASALGAAFQSDPVMSWIFPDAETRGRRVAPMFEVLARHFHLRHGLCTLAEDGGTALGGAMWDPPGEWRVGPLRTALAIPAAMRAMGGSVTRGLAVTDAFERVHPAEPHYYLAYVGARPEAQGRGVGSALLRTTLEQVDRRRMPAYLESSDEANVGYYERFGFEVIGEVRLPDGPRVPTMWRPAA